MDKRDYKTENVLVKFFSDATPQEVESLIGKTIGGVEALEYSLILTFTDGSSVSTTGSSSLESTTGSRWDECALGVEVKL